MPFLQATRRLCLPLKPLNMAKWTPPKSRSRIRFISSEDLADRITRHLELDSVPGGRIVIETHPGPGILTRSLLKAGAQKILGVEPNEKYKKELANKDERVAMVDHLVRYRISGQGSTVYNLPTQDKPLMKGGVMFHTPMAGNRSLPWIKSEPWSQPQHSAIITGIPDQSSRGQDAAALHLLQNIRERFNFHTYGRLEAVILLRRITSENLRAEPGSRSRGMMAVTAECTVDVELLEQVPTSEVYPPMEMDLVRITPHIHNPLKADLDMFLRCSRILLTRKTHPLAENIRYLGAGAEALLKDVSADPKTLTRDLTLHQLDQIAYAFEHWVHRPDAMNF
ncbi:MAG: S-adenosyl-L-methionine-dependent methyltransferase [Piptocephalis tieghemiana]|nr:MAG: S-adenosyl-L-methionine-dependent methyltransferase [Piptocephalis tieghemiana]